MIENSRKRRVKKAAPSEIKRAHPLENDPRFLRRVAQARASVREGRGVRLEDVEDDRVSDDPLPDAGA